MNNLLSRDPPAPATTREPLGLLLHPLAPSYEHRLCERLPPSLPKLRCRWCTASESDSRMAHNFDNCNETLARHRRATQHVPKDTVSHHIISRPSRVPVHVRMHACVPLSLPKPPPRSSSTGRPPGWDSLPCSCTKKNKQNGRYPLVSAFIEPPPN